MRWLTGCLQPPVIDGAGFAMCLLDVHLGNTGIVANHFQAAMTEKRLQREYVSTGPEVGDCTRMAKTMGMRILHTRSKGNALDDMPQTRRIERAAFANNKQGGVWLFPVLTFSQISPQCMPGTPEGTLALSNVS